MITLKINTVATQDYYSQTLIVECTELKLKIYMKTLAMLNKYLILVIIWLSQNTTMIQTN